MDWQHLIMNGENLAEYAALLAAEGLLGHQHANSGWGTFDDDNMVGATAFMETLELALELRRVGYGDNGERLGFDLYPYTEDAVGAVKRSVLQWRFIDGVAAQIDERRAARGAAGEGRRPRLRARLRRARRLTCARSASTSARPGSRRRDLRRTATCSRRRRRGYPLSTPQPGWSEQDPEDWWRAAEDVPRAAARGPDRPVRADARARRARRRRARAAPGDPLERPAHGRRVRRDRGARRARPADRADRQPRADRFHRAEAALAAHARARDVRADPPRAAAQGLRAAPPDRRARDRRRRRVRDAALRRRAPRAGRRRSAPRSSAARLAARPRTSRPRSPGAGDQAAAALGVGIDAPGPVSVVLGTSGVVFAALPAYAPDARGAGARLLPRGARHLARDGRDAERRRLGRLAPRTRSAPTSRTLDAEAARWAPGAEGLLFAPYLAGERTPARRSRRARRVHRPLGCATTAARSGARCSRASPTGCATRSSCSARSASQPEVGRVSGGGARSELWLRIVASVLGLPLERDRVGGGLGVRRGAARRRARGRLRRRRRGGLALRPRPRAHRSEPGWVELRASATGATDALPHPAAHWRRRHEPRRQDGCDHRREPRHRRRRRAHAARPRRQPRPRVPQRRRPRPRPLVARPCDVRDLDALVDALRRDRRPLRRHRHRRRRTRASARTGRSSTSRASTSTRCSTST